MKEETKAYLRITGGLVYIFLGMLVFGVGIGIGTSIMEKIYPIFESEKQLVDFAIFVFGMAVTVAFSYVFYAVLGLKGQKQRCDWLEERIESVEILLNL